MSPQVTDSDHVLHWNFSDIFRQLEEPPISMSSQGVVQVCKPSSGAEYVVKLRLEPPPGDEYIAKLRLGTLKLEREISFLEAAGELSVDVVSRIYDGRGGLEGFGMPRLCPIDPIKLTQEQKYDIFNQIRHIIPKLHDRGIIHGDIKLSNMLLDNQVGPTQVVKLCDFGIAAWMEEVHYPTAFSLQYCSPYRLNLERWNRLVPEEDIYASGITVWELFTGETPFGDIDPDDEEADLEGQIRGGLRIDGERIEDMEVRTYIADCLEVMRKWEGRDKNN